MAPKNLSSRALYYMAAQIAANVIGLGTGMILARYFDRSEMGDYQQLWLIYNLLSGIIILGLPSSLTYFYPTSEGPRKAASVYIVMGLLVVLGAIMGAVTFFGAPYISAYFKNERLAPLIRNFFLFYAFTLGGSYIRRFLVASNRYGFLVFWLQFDRLLMVLSFAVPAVLGLGLETAVKAAVWTAGFKFIVTTLYTMKVIPPTKLIFDAGLTMRILYFSVPLGLSSMVAHFSREIDRLIIGRFMDAEFFAIYNFGAQGLPFIGEIAESVMTVLIPVLAVLHRDGKNGQFINTWHEGIRKTAFFVLATFAFVQFFATPLMVALYSERYLESVIFFRIYQLGLLMRVTMYGQVLQSLGKTHHILIVTVVVIAVKSFLNVWLFKTFGPLGPPVGSIVMGIGVSAFYLWMIARQLGVGARRIWPWAYYWKILSAAILSGAAASTVLFIPTSRISTSIALLSAAAATPSVISLVQLILGAAIFAPAYVLLLHLFGGLRDKDWELLRDMTYRRFVRKKAVSVDNTIEEAKNAT